MKYYYQIHPLLDILDIVHPPAGTIQLEIWDTHNHCCIALKIQFYKSYTACHK